MYIWGGRCLFENNLRKYLPIVLSFNNRNSAFHKCDTYERYYTTFRANTYISKISYLSFIVERLQIK